jgi:flavin-dependent dehydrogenase
MTLADTSRYDPDDVAARAGHAVVVGASVAGLLAARVLSDAYATVTVLERDPLPDAAVERRGVPQAGQPHVLLEAGRATIEDLFPGFSESLVREGGLLLDWATDQWMYAEGGVLAAADERVPMYCASRALVERLLRERVAALAGVSLCGGVHVTDYLTDAAGDEGGSGDGDTTRPNVVGVRVRELEGDGDVDGLESGVGGDATTAPDTTGDGGGGRPVAADLVVDATGRTSRTPGWLEAHGYARPPVDEVRVDMTYATARLDRPAGDRRSLYVRPEPDRPRGLGVFPIEGGQWTATLMGVGAVDPPADREGAIAFAADLPTELPAAFLSRHDWVSDGLDVYPFPASRRRYFERLDAFPDGLVVVGDAIASFNPIYGQGISVAALEALALSDRLAAGDRPDGRLASAFFERAAGLVDDAWLMATGADASFPGTEGPTPTGAELFEGYTARLMRAAHDDGRLATALAKVVMMEYPPTALLRPGVLARVFAPRAGGDDGPAVPPSWEGGQSADASGPADD